MLPKKVSPEIAKRLRAIAVAEKHHEERYKKFLKGIEYDKAKSNIQM